MSHPIPARYQSSASAVAASTVAATSPIRRPPMLRSGVLASCLALAAGGRLAARARPVVVPPATLE